jgi:hypothetical protein
MGDYSQDDRGAHQDTELARIWSLARRSNKLLQKLHANTDDQLHRHKTHSHPSTVR